MAPPRSRRTSANSPMSTAPRVLLVFALCLLVGACVALFVLTVPDWGDDVASQAGPATPPPGGTAPAEGTPAKIEWSGCGSDFQCGTMSVPLNYDAPTGAAVQLALVRLPAGDPSN